MQTVAQQLSAILQQAAVAAGFGDQALEPCVSTNDPAHGDYQSNSAFRLAKTAKRPPRAVAEALVASLPPNELVAHAEVAGPGFVNLRLHNSFLARDLAERMADPHFGTPQLGAGKTMVIDYSSPNVAKRMHIGHLRSTVIGSAYVKLNRFLGWRVVADNHIGDWGTQFGMLIVAWHRWHDPAAYAADPVAELQRLYQYFKEQAARDPLLDDLARAETAKLQFGDPDNTALWRQFVDVSLAEFNRVYERLGVAFDVVHGESFYRDALVPLVDQLLADGIAIVNNGAVIVPFTAEDGKGLENSPFLIRKSDGAALYGTTDLATMAHRMATWSPSVIAIVTDGRQQLHFRQLFATARKQGLRDVELVHAWFGILELPGGAIASTRSGQVINLVDVLDTAAARARALVDEKSGDLPEEERARVAEQIGVGALRYFDLSQNPQSNITFDWDRSLALDGNTAPYLMYAHARCRSVLRKAAEQGHFPGGIVLSHPAERELALAIARVPEAILLAAATWRPNLLCDHLFGLAGTFSRFWEQCRVLGAEVPPETAAARLALVRATARAIEIGLGLLGVAAPERM